MELTQFVVPLEFTPLELIPVPWPLPDHGRGRPKYIPLPYDERIEEYVFAGLR